MVVQNFHKSKLFVDSWKGNHKPDGKFEDKFNGKVSMTEEKSPVYLGHVMSQDGRNYRHQKLHLNYLLEKQANGKKGRHIHYEKLELAYFLLPECSISVKEMNIY